MKNNATTSNSQARRRRPRFQSFIGKISVAALLAATPLAASRANEPVNTLPAFPGAEGYGAMATGGRGGAIVHVQNLNDSGPGSLREALSAGHRIILFDVGGCIDLKKALMVPSDVTIAGQTAPGEGICFRGQEVSFSSSQNDIVRYIRIREGMTGGAKKSAIAAHAIHNMIFDHVSVEWGRWDCVDMNESTNVTFQDCIIGEGVDPQRFGCLCGSDYITFVRNLFIHNTSRNPKAKGHVQYVNNVVYDWGVTGFVGGHSAADRWADIINSYFIKGPSSNDRFIGEFTKTDHFYQSGCVADLDRDGKLNGRAVTSADIDGCTLENHPFAPPLPNVLSAENAYKAVAASAGCSLHRDAVDQRLIDDLKSLGMGSGKIIRSPIPSDVTAMIPGGAAPKSTSGDGIPDSWKTSHGLAATDSAAATGDYDHSGYTNIEKYINGLATGADLTAGAGK